VVGSTGLDALRTMPLMDRAALEADFGFAFSDPTVMVTFHPETAGNAKPKDQMAAVLDALEQRPDLQILFTLPNPDAEGLGLGEMVRRFVASHPERSQYHVSLGHLRYLSVLKQVAAVAGNSSSGLIEVPSFGIGTLNIGHRQDGRIRAPSVIDCPETTPSAILDGISAVLDPAFRATCRTVTNPFGDGRTGPRIVEVLETIDFADLGAKRFYDLPDAALTGLL
jgi:GDP/UDP-N,N'-diacetylbacillosamine 2-epimerase (hydrolysing)